MLEILPESHGNILGIKATAAVNDHDYETVFIPKLREILAQCGKVRLLYYMDQDLEDLVTGSMWEDSTFGATHTDDFEKLATVGGPRLFQWAVNISGYFLSGEVKAFGADQLQEAWMWVSS